jgi:hypothetical protein
MIIQRSGRLQTLLILRQRKQFMQNFRVIDENPAKKKLAG